MRRRLFNEDPHFALMNGSNEGIWEKICFEEEQPCIEIVLLNYTVRKGRPHNSAGRPCGFFTLRLYASIF
jgi:hypothetical protein